MVVDWPFEINTIDLIRLLKVNKNRPEIIQRGKDIEAGIVELQY